MPPHEAIDYSKLRSGLIEYLHSQNRSEAYVNALIVYLDRWVKHPISKPTDVIALFSQIKHSRDRLWKGLRALFNYAEVVGFNRGFLDGLRKALPKMQYGIDLQVPDEVSVKTSLEKLKRIPEKYQALYTLLLDSGLRLVEAVKVIETFKDAEKINGFYRAPVGMFRGTKQAYYAYFTDTTYQRLKDRTEPLNLKNASHYFDKQGFVNPKYLRKFAFDKMIELEIPESVADFIEGRVPKRIGAKHYIVLARQANGFYSKYAEYLKRLYRK